jgi:hypothetical protein
MDSFLELGSFSLPFLAGVVFGKGEFFFLDLPVAWW